MDKIFIGGAPRTGTNLIQGILCKDEITSSMIHECIYLQYFLDTYREGKLSWDGLQFEFESKENYIKVNRDMISPYLNQLKNTYGKNKILVLKRPTLIKYFPDLDELFSNQCKFISMIRDPRDAISSFKKSEPGYSIEYYFRTYIWHYLNMKDFTKDNYLTVQYEELISDTHRIMDELRKFTGLSLNFDPMKEELDTVRFNENFISDLDGKPVNSNNIGKHKNNLTHEEINYIESYKEDINNYFGKNIFYD